MTTKTLNAMIAEAKADAATRRPAYGSSRCEVTGLICRVVPVQLARKWGQSIRWNLDGSIITKAEAAALQGAA